MKKPAYSHSLTGSKLRPWLTPHKIALVIIWLATTIATTVILINGQAGTNRSSAFRQMLHVLYVVVLLWYLARTGPSFNQLPEGRVPVKLRSKIGAWLAVLGVAIFFLQ